MRFLLIKLFPALLFFACTLGLTPACGFSLLAHEAVVDAKWEAGIKPLLKQKFGDLTGPEIKLAHSYAYGGCLMADMGYMPGGNALFTDLLHYVRSGDFVNNLLSEARTVNEYAFALGALSHYLADEYGHSLATNKTVPMVYPKLRKKFGNTVTYDDDHVSHSRMEFSYDVFEVATSGYTSASYHDFIGFNMAVPLMQKVFLLTYGQDLNTLFKNINSSINKFRWGIRSLFPNMIQNAWKSHKDEIIKLDSTATGKKFRYRMSRHMFNLEFGKEKHTMAVFAEIAAFMVRILPKIGPLKTLKFESPGPEGEKLFASSFKVIVKSYAACLTRLAAQPLNLPDIDFDTGNRTALGEYHLTDETYDKLVVGLQENNYSCLTPELKENIINFYSSATPATFAGLKPKDRVKVIAAIQQLKTAQTVNPAGLPASGDTAGKQ